MRHRKEELVRYRLSRAMETLDEARIMADTEHWLACINRLYYACFYAVSALLLQNDLIYSRHTGVRACFSREFVSKGLISKDWGFNPRRRG